MKAMTNPESFERVKESPKESLSKNSIGIVAMKKSTTPETSQLNRLDARFKVKRTGAAHLSYAPTPDRRTARFSAIISFIFNQWTSMLLDAGKSSGHSFRHFMGSRGHHVFPIPFKCLANRAPNSSQAKYRGRGGSRTNGVLNNSSNHCAIPACCVPVK